MTKEEYKKSLESKICKMFENGNFEHFDAGLKDLPLPQEEEEKSEQD